MEVCNSTKKPQEAMSRKRKDPCENCLRWPECNGVDANTCPLCRREETKQKAVPAYLDDKTLSGLLED
jgi:hypothetical protein